jgi:hypothetical protein
MPATIPVHAVVRSRLDDAYDEEEPVGNPSIWATKIAILVNPLR